METSKLQSRVLKTEHVNWREFKFIQADNFKSLSAEARHKLKASILSNNFTQPFYVWEDPEGTLYCLDGKHRTMLLEELINEGHEIPYMLPATFIQCENKKQAAKLVTIYSSIYAKIEQQGLFDFIQAYELEFEDLKLEIDLPEFSMDRFEQKFDLFEIKDTENDDEEIEIPEGDQIIVKPGDKFRLGDHLLYCCSYDDEDNLIEMMAGEKARILLTDPPYNLPADFFTNISETVTHEDFDTAHGEMSDEEFTEFLRNIMALARLHTVDGSIHYLFMDFRHSWHICQAAKQVYESVEPKQVCVWNKDTMALGSFYRSKYELVFIFKSGSAAHLSHLDLKDRIRTNVWNYPGGSSTANPDRDQLKNHPTPKPVAMLADAILDTTNSRDLVIDFFVGSGSTIIACEKTSRRCRATEIKPQFVQSTIVRYLRYCDKNGIVATFEHLNGSLTINDFNDARFKTK